MVDGPKLIWRSHSLLRSIQRHRKGGGQVVHVSRWLGPAPHAKAPCIVADTDLPPPAQLPMLLKV